MPNYRFFLENLHVISTRTLIGGDTGYASFALRVGDQFYDPLTKSLGKLNGGDFPLLGLFFDAVSIATPDTKIRLTYRIENSGFSESTINTALRDAANAALGATLSAAIGVIGLVPQDPNISAATGFTSPIWILALTGTGGGAGFAALASALGTDCDGTVVYDVIEVTRQELDEQIAANGGVYRETRNYPWDPRFSLPTFCQKWLYTVTWAVWQIPDKTKEDKESKEKGEEKSPSKDHKELKDDRGDVLDRADAPAGVVERLSQADGSGQESSSASGQAFIRSEERPSVGEQALRRPSA